jgi:hypothetical protein
VHRRELLEERCRSTSHAAYDHASPRQALGHRRQQAVGVGCLGLGRNRPDLDDRRVPRRGATPTGAVAGRRRRRGADRGPADHRLIRSARPSVTAASAVRPRRRDGAGRQHHRRTRCRAHVDRCRVRGRRSRGVCRRGDARGFPIRAGVRPLRSSRRVGADHLPPGRGLRARGCHDAHRGDPGVGVAGLRGRDPNAEELGIHARCSAQRRRCSRSST